MKEWELVLNEEEFNKIASEMKYEGPSPYRYPCVVCRRVSISRATCLNIEHPAEGLFGQHLHPSSLEKLKEASNDK